MKKNRNRKVSNGRDKRVEDPVTRLRKAECGNYDERIQCYTGKGSKEESKRKEGR